MFNRRDDSVLAPSPMELDTRLHARDTPPNSAQYTPGHGGFAGTDINNNGMFALFGLLSAAFVIASIWFFFWAKNGGFRFRKGDWEDYKSTVLRRKGPNGTTLSGATKTTALGGGSIVGSQASMHDFADLEKGGFGRGKKFGRGQGQAQKTKNSHDADVRAYRHERVARVGGLNRNADGAHAAGAGSWTGDDMSDIPVSPANYKTRAANNRTSPSPRTPHKPGGRHFSYNLGAEATFSTVSDDSSRPLRSSPYHGGYGGRYSNDSTPSGTPHHSRQPSPTKRTSGAPPAAARQSASAGRDRFSSHQSMPGSYTDALDFDTQYAGSDHGAEPHRASRGYAQPIPGLGRSGGGPGGFRRGGGLRRDSLSDSDGDTYRF